MEIKLEQDGTLPSKPDVVFSKNAKLQEHERRYERIFEDSIDGLILWDYQYHIVDVNFTAEKLFGLPKEKLIGRLFYEPFSKLEKQSLEIKKHIKQVIEKGYYTSIIVFEMISGKNRHIEISSKLDIMTDLNFTALKDITEKMDMQEQLRKSETLKVIGELAAGIAHEIRNPMTALKGFIQLLEGSIKQEHSMYYEVITSELERIDTIINEFLLLAKPQEIRFQEKNLNKIMRETLDILHAQAVLHNVQFSTGFDEKLSPIFCEPNQLKKVFINLIKNAIEVMPDGGTITVRIEAFENNQALISIQDEGIGISKEKLQRLGEAFFTTKERGTGLGLMVSYKIIEEHKGSIRIESEVGKGTTFFITLPLH